MDKSLRRVGVMIMLCAHSKPICPLYLNGSSLKYTVPHTVPDNQHHDLLCHDSSKGHTHKPRSLIFRDTPLAPQPVGCLSRPPHAFCRCVW